MASITQQPNGCKTIQFTTADGTRRSVRLGRVSLKFAEGVKLRVERLVAAIMIKQPLDIETSKWLTEIDGRLHHRLANARLTKPRVSGLLGDFVNQHLASRTDIKPATAIAFHRVRRHLIEIFGEDQPLAGLTTSDGEKYRLALIGKGLADNTVRKRCGIAKQFLAAAKRAGLIHDNPFDGLPSTAKGNPARYRFITTEQALAVIEACPDDQWRLLFALARFGGLRCPTEILALTWGDIDWNRQTMRVTCVKTEHHDGKAYRVTPIFPEIMTYLRRVFEAAEPGEKYVITRYRRANVNLRTQLLRIIRRAGLQPWPRLFQNLRSSRETELAEIFPVQVVTQWIGNSPMVALQHYLQVRPEHFDQASRMENSLTKAVQKAVQYGAELSRIEGNGAEAISGIPYNSSVFLSAPFSSEAGMGATGLEPVTSSL